MILYEYPFNERIRTLLRLEDLFERFTFFVAQEDAREHHVALTTLFEISEVAGRADLKSDLMKELERQRQTLAPFRGNPGIEQNALEAVLGEIEQTLANLAQMQGKTGQHLIDNEWLASIRSRAVIPAAPASSISLRTTRGSSGPPSSAARTSPSGRCRSCRCATPR